MEAKIKCIDKIDYVVLLDMCLNDECHCGTGVGMIAVIGRINARDTQTWYMETPAPLLISAICAVMV